MKDRRIRVKINVPVLISHLAREEGKAVTQDQALKWLVDAGFARDGEYWEVREADLGQLDPSEVLDVKPVDEHGQA
ncbi:MAG TPA: hypothetical protein VH518_25050 [Tepidisphaeraceae bacterium]|jgi:hypothetical protein